MVLVKPARRRPSRYAHSFFSSPTPVSPGKSPSLSYRLWWSCRQAWPATRWRAHGSAGLFSCCSDKKGALWQAHPSGIAGSAYRAARRHGFSFIGGKKRAAAEGLDWARKAAQSSPLLPAADVGSQSCPGKRSSARGFGEEPFGGALGSFLGRPRPRFGDAV